LTKLPPYILFEKIYLYFCIGNGQSREPALCQLYRHTFVPMITDSAQRAKSPQRRRAMQRHQCRRLRQRRHADVVVMTSGDVVQSSTRTGRGRSPVASRPDSSTSAPRRPGPPALAPPPSPVPAGTLQLRDEQVAIAEWPDAAPLLPPSE